MSQPPNNDNTDEAGHYVVTAHNPGGVIVSTKCSFVEPDSIVSVNVSR